MLKNNNLIEQIFFKYFFINLINLLEIIYVKVVLLIALSLCRKMQFGKGNQYGKR